MLGRCEGTGSQTTPGLGDFLPIKPDPMRTLARPGNKRQFF
jgi:hypothetical protein